VAGGPGGARRTFYTDIRTADVRGKLDTDTLLTVVVVLVAAWLVLATVGLVVDFLSVVPNLIGVAIIALIGLWWFDYI
jgi:hypothetical protein